MPTTSVLNTQTKLLIAATAAVIVAFAAITVLRGAFLEVPKTDAQVFFRAGWAVWEGVSPYSVRDDNGWSFLYPPFFSILMLPFANPPQGEQAPWFALPYPVAIGVWYMITVGCLLWSLHLGARLTEKYFLSGIGDFRHGERGFWHPWWFLRLGPFWAFLIVESGVVRGQITPILLLLILGFAALLAERKSFLAGFVLSLAAAIKIFPLLLMLLPTLRRDWSCIAGFVLGCVVWLAILPVAVWGADGTGLLYLELLDVQRGLIADNIERTGAGGVHADMIGFGQFVFKHWCVALGCSTSGNLPTWATMVHIICTAMFLFVFMFATHGRAWRLRGVQPDNQLALLLAIAVLMAVIVPATPAAQSHYITLGIFLHMLLIGLSWNRSNSTQPPMWIYCLGAGYFLFALINAIPEFGRLEMLTLGLYPLLISIFIGIVELFRSTPPLRKRLPLLYGRKPQVTFQQS